MRDLFNARFRWMILQAMMKLRETSNDLLEENFDQVYGVVRDLVRKKVTEIVGEGAAIELALVQIASRRVVEGLANVLHSPRGKA